MGVDIKKGLEGVTIAESALSFIDGEKGILRYRGYDINDLAESASFEEVAYLLWFGELPHKKQLSTFDKELKDQRALPSAVLKWIKTFPKDAHPLDVLRTVVSALALYDKSAHDVSRDETIRKGIKLTAAFPTIIAAFERIPKN